MSVACTPEASTPVSGVKLATLSVPAIFNAMFHAGEEEEHCHPTGSKEAVLFSPDSAFRICTVADTLIRYKTGNSEKAFLLLVTRPAQEATCNSCPVALGFASLTRHADVWWLESGITAAVVDSHSLHREFRVLSDSLAVLRLQPSAQDPATIQDGERWLDASDLHEIIRFPVRSAEAAAASSEPARWEVEISGNYPELVLRRKEEIPAGNGMTVSTQDVKRYSWLPSQKIFVPKTKETAR